MALRDTDSSNQRSPPGPGSRYSCPAELPGPSASRRARITSAALSAGLAHLAAALVDPSAVFSARGPWRFSLDAGRYDEHALLLRAAMAHTLWAAHVPEETVYARATHWPSGHALSGTIPALVHFAPGQLPPVDAFWSLTLYGPDLFLVPNVLDRFSFSGDTPGLVYGPDGSLDIVVQPNERNQADQRLLEDEIWKKNGIRVEFLTLEQLGKSGRLDATTGDKILKVQVGQEERPVSVVYYRAGYTPDDYLTEDHWRVRQLVVSTGAVTTLAGAPGGSGPGKSG
jgi:hypothetical protein